MEFQIRTPELARALARVQGVVEKKTTMPILANVLIKSKGVGAVTVSATDLEIGLTADYEAKVKTAGALTVGARALYDIVKALPEAVVTLKQATNAWVEVTCGKVKYRVVGMAAESFPQLPKFADVPFFAVDVKVLRSMIASTINCASTDETRFSLTGVFCERVEAGTGLRMVATDGHRLAVIERGLSEAPVMKDPAIIPRKGLVEMTKLLDEAKDTVRIGFVENSVVMETAGVMLTMRLVDGKFPDYQQVLPPRSERRATVDRAEMLAALKRVGLMSPDKSSLVRCDVKPGLLELHTNNPDLGEADDSVEAAYEGEPLRIGLNIRYVADALGTIPAEKVDIEFTDALSPAVFFGVGVEGLKLVVMPMRV